MREAVGPENFFIFGHTTPQVAALRAEGYQPRTWMEKDAELTAVLEALRGGLFSPEEPGRYQAIYDTLVNWGDHYLLLADFADYLQAQARVDQLYRRPADWTARAIANVAGMGAFSSDRSIREYASRIWRVEPLR